MPENKAPEDSKWVKPSPETIAEADQASKVGGVVQVAASLDELTVDLGAKTPHSPAPPELHDGLNEGIAPNDGSYPDLRAPQEGVTQQKG